ncbi:MAG TPA: class I SAM-dependent methyltransferase [Usitatibacter sp.]|nr:class I SAM-dependent methyltransferase [Usitatibacter sp.]
MEQERYAPGDKGEIWCEHWHRYHYMAPLAQGKRVLDVACGEGYGAALLARSAARVSAVDAAPDVLARARSRYGALANLEFLDGRCEALPLEARSVDLAVSFETLEHIDQREKFLDELGRVLDPAGLLAISTPDREVYSEARNYRNPHHVHEYRASEFAELLRARFAHVAFVGQRFDTYSLIWPLEGEGQGAQLLEGAQHDAERPAHSVSDPMYLIAVCGAEGEAVQAATRAISVLADREHFVLSDYQSLIRRLGEVSAQAERIEAAYNASQRQLAQLARERDALLARLEGTKAPGPGTPPQKWRTR